MNYIIYKMDCLEECSKATVNFTENIEEDMEKDCETCKKKLLENIGYAKKLFKNDKKVLLLVQRLIVCIDETPINKEEMKARLIEAYYEERNIEKEKKKIMIDVESVQNVEI